MQPTPRITSAEVEFLRAELAGKVRATGEYDQIIWRIRSGYLVVLYGILALMVGTEKVPSVQQITDDFILSTAILLSIIGFSASGFLIDYKYTSSKLRVVVARDALVRRFIRLIGSSSLEPLARLLKLSGEDPALFEATPPPGPADMNDEMLVRELRRQYARRLRQNLKWILIPLYGIAPLIALIILVIASIQFGGPTGSPVSY